MQLDNRIMRLIAVGASITANCQPCLQANIRKARELGADDGDIAQAIEIGKLVRQASAAKMDRFASSLAGSPVGVAAATDECDCECNS